MIPQTKSPQGSTLEGPIEHEAHDNRNTGASETQGKNVVQFRKSQRSTRSEAGIPDKLSGAFIPRECIRFLPSTTSAVFVALLVFRNSKTGQCNPPISWIVELVGKSQAAVERALVQLREGKHISWETIRPERRKADARRHFTILDYPAIPHSKEDSHNYAHPHSENGFNYAHPQSFTSRIRGVPYKV